MIFLMFQVYHFKFKYARKPPDFMAVQKWKMRRLGKNERSLTRSFFPRKININNL